MQLIRAHHLARGDAHHKNLRRNYLYPRRKSYKYQASTFWRAQGVLRKKVRLDFMLGSLVKQRTFIRCAKVSQPWRSTNMVKMASRVMP